MREHTSGNRTCSPYHLSNQLRLKKQHYPFNKELCTLGLQLNFTFTGFHIVSTVNQLPVQENSNGFAIHRALEEVPLTHGVLYIVFAPSPLLTG